MSGEKLSDVTFQRQFLKEIPLKTLSRVKLFKENVLDDNVLKIISQGKIINHIFPMMILLNHFFRIIS